jgi:hypothetical protein
VGNVRLKSKDPRDGIGRQWAQVEILTPKQFNSIVYNPKPLIRPTPDRPIAYYSKDGLGNTRNLFIAYDMKLAEDMYGGLEVVWFGDTSDNTAQWPVTKTRLAMDYIKKPTTARWDYNVINEKALYNPSTSVHFELHDSEEVELVNKILSLAGIVVRTPELYQAAVAEDNKNITQEKQ